MTVIRDGINLTKLSNTTLRRIVDALCESPEVNRQYMFMLPRSQNFGSRLAVHFATVAIDAWTHCNTVTTATPPSPESLDWSNLEGGSLHHCVPSFSKWFESVFDTLKDREYDSSL